MGMMLVPLKADKVTAWHGFAEELNGPRKADFAEFNKRYKLTKHEAWLCETPAGAFVCAIHEGPGAADDPERGKVDERVRQVVHLEAFGLPRDGRIEAASRKAAGAEDLLDGLKHLAATR